MEQYYCTSCGNICSTLFCDLCNKQIKDVRCCYGDMVVYPAKDRVRIGFLFRLSLAISLALFLILSILELSLNRGNFLDYWVFLTRNGILLLVMQVFVSLFAMGMFIFIIQGKEVTQYLIEPKGVLKKTWIEPSNIKCWSRLVRLKDSEIKFNSQGKAYALVHEAYIRLSDVDRCRTNFNKTKLKIYHPYNFLFMDITIDKADSDAVFRIAKINSLLKK